MTCKDCLHYDVCAWDGGVNVNTYNPDNCSFVMPKSDYVKRERGEWIVESYKTSNAKFMSCSNCKSVIDLELNTAIDENEFDFCPYCNADMRKEDNNG